MRMLIALVTIAMTGIDLSASDTISPSDCASMLRQIRDNYRSVSSYDVVISYVRTEEGEGISSTTRNYCRVAYTPKPERLSYIITIELKDNLATTIRTSTEARLVQDGYSVVTDFQSAPVKSSRIDLHRYLGGVENIFMVGAEFFPSATHAPEKIDAVWDDNEGAITAYGKVRLADGVVYVDVDNPKNPQLGDAFSRWHYAFDARTSLLTRYSCKYVREFEGSLREVDRYRSSFGWCEPIEGVYLPSDLSIKEIGAALDSSGKPVRVQATTTVNIDWKSVNRQVDPKMWDTSHLMDFEKALKLCGISKDDGK